MTGCCPKITWNGMQFHGFSKLIITGRRLPHRTSMGNCVDNIVSELCVVPKDEAGEGWSNFARLAGSASLLSAKTWTPALIATPLRTCRVALIVCASPLVVLLACRLLRSCCNIYFAIIDSAIQSPPGLSFQPVCATLLIAPFTQLALTWPGVFCLFVCLFPIASPTDDFVYC